MAKKTVITEEIVDDIIPENVDVTDQVDESAGSDTMHPNSKPVNDPKTKVGYLKALINGLNALEIDGQAEFFKHMMAHLNNHTPSGDSENKASIKTYSKGAVKEDFLNMFGADDTLTEDFKTKASTLFETAVETRVATEVLRIEEEQEEATAEGIEMVVEELTEQLDTYLQYAVDQFMEENAVAIESQLRSDICEQFIGNLRDLFIESNFNVPVEKTDVLDALATRVDELEEALDLEVTKSADLTKQLSESDRKDTFVESTADLSAVQLEKFKKLAESIDFDGNIETYTKKLAVIKEGFLESDRKPSGGKKLASLEEETGFEQEPREPRNTSLDPTVAAYANMLSVTARKS